MLPAGATIDLGDDWHCRKSGKAKVGKDGRPIAAVKPVGSMREVWKRFQARRGEIVKVRETRTADSYLSALTETADRMEFA